MCSCPRQFLSFFFVFVSSETKLLKVTPRKKNSTDGNGSIVFLLKLSSAVCLVSSRLVSSREKFSTARARSRLFSSREVSAVARTREKKKKEKKGKRIKEAREANERWWFLGRPAGEQFARSCEFTRGYNLFTHPYRRSTSARVDRTIIVRRLLSGCCNIYEQPKVQRTSRVSRDGISPGACVIAILPVRKVGG